MKFGEIFYIPAQTVIWPLDEAQSYMGGFSELTKEKGYGILCSSKQTYDRKIRVFLINENSEYYVRLDSISIIGEKKCL